MDKLAIGQKYQGGIIIYIDATGQHGLIAAPSDKSPGIQWCNGSPEFETGAIGVAIGKGRKNTEMIVAKQGAGKYAAKLCADLVLDGYDGWFLPSIDELNALYHYLERLTDLLVTATPIGVLLRNFTIPVLL